MSHRASDRPGVALCGETRETQRDRSGQPFRLVGHASHPMGDQAIPDAGEIVVRLERIDYAVSLRQRVVGTHGKVPTRLDPHPGPSSCPRCEHIAATREAIAASRMAA